MGIRNNRLCEFCDEIDFIEHFFWRCKRLREFWKNVENTICNKTGNSIKITEESALFGFEKNKSKQEVNKITNHILLIAKMTISKHRYGVGLDINCMFDMEVMLRCGPR